MPPVGRVDITAADAVGSAPITSIELPDNGGKPLAEDWQNVAAMALANAFGSGYAVRSQHKDIVTSSPWAIASPNNAAGNTWTSTSITLDVANCKVGDVIEVYAHGNWQLNSSTAPGDVVGRAKLLFTENVGGSPSVIGTVYDLATITDDGGSLVLPHNEPWQLAARHTVVAAGTTRIVVQGRSEDLTGGAGTGTIVFMFSARMDITHWRKS